jgi:uncharacterized membrane protein
MIEALLRDLRQPEYLHVLLNPLPIYGLAAGLLALFVALLLRSPQARIASFIVIIVCSASAWPVYELGEQAYDPALSLSDDQGQVWLKEHKARAEKLIVLFYVIAATGISGLVASWKSDKLSFIAALLVLVLGLTTLGAGGYIAYAGGRIRHREFRTGPTLLPP